MAAALPGALYIYQGDELGLEEVTDLPDSVLTDPVWSGSDFTDRGRDGCRVPLPWTADGPSFGFSPGLGWLPQPTEWGQKSVEAQLADPDSFLSHYRYALALRRSLPELRQEKVSWLESDPDILAFSRGARGELVCAINLGTDPATVPGVSGPPLLKSDPGSADDGLLTPNACAWWRINDD
jgi:alpha-glucosidase